MKKIYGFVFLLLVVFLSCEEDKIDVYKADSFIQFENAWSDSTVCSWLAYANENTLRYPVVVRAIGKVPKDKDRPYQIQVYNDYTVATEAEFEIPTDLSIKAGKAVDTCWIVFKRTPEISKKALRLTIRLVDNEYFKLGESANVFNIIYTSDVIAKPDWWTSNVTNSYLGDYSDKKYRLFIEVTGEAEIDSSDRSVLRYYGLIFKNYLQKQKDANNTVYEEDGQEMTVTMIGG